MPYVISVLTLVILAVGYTLIQTTPADEISVFTETPIITRNEEDITEIPSTSAASTTEFAVTTEEPTTAPSVPATTATPSSASAPTPVIAYDYQNGTYSTDSTYRTPDGTYTMTVSLTVTNDIVTNSVLTFSSKAARSDYSINFNDSYQSQVINKDLDTISLSRVGGASLTTSAFNSALQTIRQQAS